ncbi:MAG: histidine phosphatase family protein [Nocardioidaceae bacterium]
MATLLLVRHGRTQANTAGVLAGRTGGVRLDDLGRAQAQRVGARLGGVPLAALVSSPLVRCRQTGEAILAAQQSPPAPTVERALTECDYGDWQGRPLRELAKEKLWHTVQVQPSAAGFPGGETLPDMQARAVSAVRRHEAAVVAEHGPHAVWVAVSHGDVIKAVLADALGLHLDLFQRIQVDPASVSVVRYTPDRPYVLGMNTHEGALDWTAAKPPARRRRGAEVGGGAGPEKAPSRRSRG